MTENPRTSAEPDPSRDGMPGKSEPTGTASTSVAASASVVASASVAKKGARQRRVTITDVGTAAGVSTSTVSRVLNGTARVDPELARRVQDAVAELGYRPNAAAQGLARGEAGAIGVLVPDLSNPYFPDVLKSVSAVARSHGRRVMVMESDEDATSEHERAEDLMRCCDGVLLCSPRMNRAELVDLSMRGHPVVLVNRIVPGLSLPSVSVDFYGGMTLVCGHLTQLGHRRVAYLSGPEASWANAERIRAFDAAAAFGVDVTVIPCGHTARHGYAAADAVRDSGVTAVVAYNDLVALGAVTALEESGLRVPEDMSVIGCDDISLDDLPSSRRLTTASLARDELGRQAAQTLEALMAANGDTEPRVIPMELRVRHTSAPPAVPAH
ncbi:MULTISPECIES: LacI family DNA-binding transcriptional regulator [unclassified Streptomyces]|uniref:LacI family DNA-binding transcriptional regulator n=1 Tax=unclassified Streptomyces TaxID=2593676 RepID=UPI00364A09FA